MARVNDEGFGLVKLGDTDLTLEVPSREDVRGRGVRSTGGEEIGTPWRASAWTIESARRASSTCVRAGDLLGKGEKRSLMPVGAASDAEEDRITVEPGREQVPGSPPLDARVAPDVRYQREVREHYRDLPCSPLGP